VQVDLFAEDGSARRRELTVEVDSRQSVGELAAAIARHLGVAHDGALGLHVVRTGATVPADGRVGGLELQQGDVLRIERSLPVRLGTGGATTDPVDRSVLELSVVGGPLSGRRFPLHRGVYVLGRDATCTIPLDDETASRRHLQLTIGADGVMAEDLGSTNGTFVEGRRITGPTRLVAGQVVEVGSTLLTVGTVDGGGPTPSAVPPVEGWRPFNRPPRVNRPHRPQTFVIGEPPAKPAKSKFPMGAAVIPVILGVVMFAALSQPMFLLFALMGPAMMTWSLVDDLRSGRRDHRAARATFEQDLESLERRVAEAHAAEVAQRRAAAPPAPDLVARIEHARPDLWERRADDADFLTVRVGIADLPSELTIEVSPRGDADLQARAQRLADAFATDTAVPLTVPLSSCGVLGIAGPVERRRALARWIITQAAVLQSPRDVALVVLATPEDAAHWEWTKWLPHTSVLLAAAGGGRSVAGTRDDVVALFDVVDELVSSRHDSLESRTGRDGRFVPEIVLVVPSHVAIPRAALSELLQRGPAVGVRAIVLADAVHELPGECRAVVELDVGADELSLTFTTTGERVERAIADGIPAEIADSIAVTSAPLRDVSAGSAAGELPLRQSLLDLLDLKDPTPGAVAARWRARPPGLAALVGAVDSGPLSLDLRADGPHALIAGTTGAGKSELLQTLVVSLAVTHPPDRLTFILVDYKGGAGIDDLKALPHTAGFVTDLDEHLAERALLSLNAELKRREHLLSELKAKDILEAESSSPDRSPPNLAIVIDEFATLAKEVPDFVTGVVDIAQRGRSLGVHLVLATQRPTGVVNDNIRANTNLRIALRVSDEGDSRDVIDVPDAAHIARRIPGRGLVRTGHGEVRAFQTAYVGGPHRVAGDFPPVRVHDFHFGPGLLEDATQRDASASTPTGEKAPTDLAVLVRAIAAAATEAGAAVVGSPWTEPLPYLLPLAHVAVSGDGGVALEPGIGVVDEPSLQRQATWRAPLGRNGHLLVYGTSGSGKTTVLRTLAASAARQRSPRALHIYGLDCASRGLFVLEELPHCGGVVAVGEIERVERLFAMLDASIDERREQFARVGASSLQEYASRVGDAAPPAILVLLDGYGGFRSAFEQVDHGALVDRLEQLVADGRAVGVHFVITADRRGSVAAGLAGLIADRLVLRMADADEYSMLGLPSSTKGAVLPPGRGFVDDGVEIQVAVVGDAASGDVQAESVAALGRELRAEHVDVSVPPVQLLPDHVERSSLAPATAGRLVLPIGLDGASFATAFVDLDDVPHFLVMGPDRTGRSTTLATFAASWRDAMPGAATYVFAPRRSPLRDLAGWTEIAVGLDACEELAGRLAEQVRTRSEHDEPILVLVDDGDEIAEGKVATALEQVIRRGRDTGVHVVGAAQTHVVHRSYGGWLAELKKLKHGLILQPDVDVDGDIFGVRLPRKSARAFPPGRGYVVRRSHIVLVQVTENT
jgi:S-DNA-T family DNA segregation ATPase FtsK/SpoIIIE